MEIPSEALSIELVFCANYGTPAPSAESQQPEAWPARIYGHLREPARLRESADISVASNIHFDNLPYENIIKWMFHIN